VKLPFSESYAALHLLYRNLSSRPDIRLPTLLSLTGSQFPPEIGVPLRRPKTATYVPKASGLAGGDDVSGPSPSLPGVRPERPLSPSFPHSLLVEYLVGNAAPFLSSVSTPAILVAARAPLRPFVRLPGVSELTLLLLL